jgi:hypothetical protein
LCGHLALPARNRAELGVVSDWNCNLVIGSDLVISSFFHATNDVEVVNSIGKVASDGENSALIATFVWLVGGLVSSRSNGANFGVLDVCVLACG